MGRKGSGRPRDSDKPLSEVFQGFQDNIYDLYKMIRKLDSKVNYHKNKHLRLEKYRAEKLKSSVSSKKGGSVTYGKRKKSGLQVTR